MKFSSSEEFELHVHKCFGKIFEQLMKVDAVIKERAEQEEAEGKYGVMSDLRDSIEDVILHCHLAWQYHRLSKAVGSASTWDKMETEAKKEEGASTQEKG
ncbi:MAG: hypothetical protein ACLP5H_28275 [Desulfomonilaceae bacterium]